MEQMHNAWRKEQKNNNKKKQIECSFIMQTKNKVGGLSMWMWSKVMQRRVELQQRYSLFVCFMHPEEMNPGLSLLVCELHPVHEVEGLS